MSLSKLLAAVAFVVAGFVFSTGVASAHHGENENGAWSDCETRADGPECAPHWAPVGQNLLDPDFPGRDGLPGGPFDEPGVTPGYQGNAVAGITHNPNCPLHWEAPMP